MQATRATELLRTRRRGGGGGHFECPSFSKHLFVHSYHSLTPSCKDCRSLSVRMCLNNLASSANKYISLWAKFLLYIDNNPNFDYTGMVFVAFLLMCTVYHTFVVCCNIATVCLSVYYCYYGYNVSPW